ncbi:MAG: VWA domain-containing protein [Cyclobacteriaceae bacterium]
MEENDFEQFPEDIGIVETPKQFHQLGILVLDGSGSMQEQAQGGLTKANAVNDAVRELFTRFKVSRVKQNFSFAVVAFDNTATLVTAPTEAAAIDDNGNYDPLSVKGGGTCIFEGLELSEKMANDFLENETDGGVYHSVVILVMTDGMCFDPSKTTSSAENIKNGSNGGKITICTTYFGKIGESNAPAKELLKKVATDPVMGFKEVYDAETLRSFFEKSISAASGVNID